MANPKQKQEFVPSANYYYDLGSFGREVTTTSKEAQIWFNRGITWTYAFNHDEAAECFEQAIKHDPQCAMAYWGVAYALGPNYNKPWEAFDDEDREKTIHRAHHALLQATILAKAASAVEKALIHALQKRFPEDHAVADFKVWNVSYANKMEAVYNDFSDDLDVAALFADALMNLNAWQLWNLVTGEPATRARTMDAKRVLDRALAREGGLKHPGLIHLYIHLMEMSPTPEAALPVANHLRGLIPDSGHLNHMPTHLDILCGDWQSAIISNSDAIIADEKFVARAGALNFYTLYRAHNYHFRIYAAMFAGQSQVALDTVTQLEAELPEEVLSVKSPPMADWLESFLSARVHVLVRFGRWQDILNISVPKNKELFSFTTAMVYYAKGVALSALGRVEAAQKERETFLAAFKRVPPTRMLFNNRCTDILAIASAMLDGELEYRRRNFDVAFSHLRRSISLDAGLPYDEPWGWMQPTRHAYGALMLEQGHVEEALATYSADLGIDSTLPRPLRHPNNVWALKGYHECLVKLGRTEEARMIEPQVKAATALADIPITSSCFCRLSGPQLANL
jgi:tetratricopeptide (TPR) repeat protein